MLFQTPGFLFIFLPVFLAAVALVPKGTPRTVVIVAFSYLFYSGSEPAFALLLLTSTVVDYFAALNIDAAQSKARRKGWLILSVCTNLSLLGFFKYGGMLYPGVGAIGSLLGMPAPDPLFFERFVLPAGISFYTFQSMSYTIDVYRRELKPEQSFIGFMGYVAYLPQLIAGPIERFAHLYPQLQAAAWGKAQRAWSAGLDRMSLGIIQKLLFADACGRIVDRMLQQDGYYSLVDGWAVAIGFGLQIYYDFAAYTHMAIGISLLLGIRLAENFLSPYKAQTIQQFWQRWHITLSSWFRDYLYIPLGGSRKGYLRTAFNVSVTFLLCGLWHGANWNFVAWGAMHGAMLSGYHLIKRRWPEALLPSWLAVALTFALVSYAWVLFRVDDPDTLVAVWTSMSGGAAWLGFVLPSMDLLFLAGLTVATLSIPNAAQRWPGRSGWIESALLWGLALFAVLSIPEVQQFIYFQF